LARPSLSVVIPAYNESDTLDRTVANLRDGLSERVGTGSLRSFEILIIENGSSDDTLAKADRLARDHDDVRVRSLDRPDYGAALRTGILGAESASIACFDADYYDLHFLDAALAALADADLVIASKRAPGSIDTRPRTRRFVTATFSAVLHVGFGVDLTDTHGMKVMRRDTLVDLAARCVFDADLFDTELVVRAVRSRLRVVELPVMVVETRPSRTAIWRRVPRAALGLVRLRLALAGSAD
jgi:glycosyltransferase involved in cell wall biosynthesis